MKAYKRRETRRKFELGVALVLSLFLTAAASAQQAVPAAKRMNTLGAENALLAQRVGTWDVTETVRATPGAAPTANHYRVTRKMIGSFLQEVAVPEPGAADPSFRRIYYLSFNRVEGRWKYVSLVTNSPVGLMPAASFGPSQNGTITLQFEPFAGLARQLHRIRVRERHSQEFRLRPRPSPLVGVAVGRPRRAGVGRQAGAAEATGAVRAEAAADVGGDDDAVSLA